jgi:glycolate oxidase iron-sulfur subunit
MTQPPPTITAPAREALLRYEKSLDCVHCGLCLSVCPTYKETANEAASPRGRIYLMRGLAEGQLSPTDGFAQQMDLCLMCRACETVCPSGVEFGRMMEITRAELATHGFGSRLGRAFRRFLLRRVIPSRRLLGIAAGLTRSYKRGVLGKVARGLRLRALLPRGLRALEPQIPDIPPQAQRAPMPSRIAAHPGAPRRGTVALLSGCVMEQLFGDVNRRTAEALARQGFDVLVPEAQTCCGALHAHAGDMEGALALAKRNVDAFLSAAPEWIVLNSAGCGASMKEYAHWLADDPDYRENAATLSAKVIDVLELFDRLRLEPAGREGPPIKATYDAPCHLRHAQRCATAPLAVLARTKGLDLVPLPGADDCCGAAGIYNLTHPEMSAALLSKKLDQLASTGATLLLTGNPGCILQWRKGIADRGLDIRVAHPVEVL